VLPIVPYFKMMGLVGTAACVLTDSSTVQEEATILGVPCLTLHNYTERRITVEQGTNIAVGRNSSLIHRAVAEIIRGGGKKRPFAQVLGWHDCQPRGRPLGRLVEATPAPHTLLRQLKPVGRPAARWCCSGAAPHQQTPGLADCSREFVTTRACVAGTQDAACSQSSGGLRAHLDFCTV